MSMGKEQLQTFLKISIVKNNDRNTSCLTIEERKRAVKSGLKSLKCYSKDSTSPPKRILKQMFKQFFENHIVVCEKKFYCCCCKKFLAGHRAAFEHTSETDHCDLLERATATKRSWILLSDKTNFKLLVSEAIISFDANNFKCRICDDEAIAISKLTEHLKNFWHVYRSLKFDQKSIEQRDGTSSILSDIEQSCDLVKYEKILCPECIICPNTFSAVRAWNNPEKNSEKEETKEYVRQSVAPENEAHNHCATIPEVPNLQHQEIQLSSFIASDEKTVSSPKVTETLTAPETRSSSPVVQTKTGDSSIEIAAPPARLRRARYPRSKSKTSLNFPIPKSPEESSRDYLFWKQNFNTFLCKICNKSVTEGHGITEHAAETEHVELFKKYGCENITMIEAYVYNCACCSCTIPGRKNVFAHLKGRRHSTCFAAMLRDKKSEIVKSSSTNQSDASNEKKSELVIYVQHFQSLSIKKMIMRRLRAQRQAAPLENFKCDYCQLPIVEGINFHSHLASHISLECANSIMDENANDPCNFGLEKRVVKTSENHIKPKELSAFHLITEDSSNRKENEKKSNYSTSIYTF